jgi:hypothetical protein
MRHLEWIRKNQAEPGQQVRCVIVAREITEDLLLACLLLADVQLFEYELSLKLNLVNTCPSPKCHPIPECLAWVSCNLARRRYIPFPKLLKLKLNEFWRRTGYLVAKYATNFCLLFSVSKPANLRAI